MELKRDLLEELIAWKSKRKRKPLILQGACIGKVYHNHTN